jgi:phenylalanyl-tRNA synthetase beta chain
MAVAMDGIKIEDSPKWMQDRLIAVGVRPINNIVDITNYVLMELGQPLHAFDAGLLGDKIVVRRAGNREVIETLDGEKRELDKNDIVITDGEKPVAIGGVMGGANSEINDKTSSIIIESANFNYVSIRRTSQRLGLRTESSMRFEKGLDPNLAELALARAVELVKRLCPKARVVSNLVDEKKFQLNQGPIELNLEWLEKRIGERVDDKKVVKILESLGFIIKPHPNPLLSKERGLLNVFIPTWRATRDISIPEDLVEEIARIYGYDNLKPKRPVVEMKAPEINEKRVLERKIKNILTGAPALTEVYNYSFVGEEQLKRLNIDYGSHIRLANPIAAHQTMLRQSLAPNLVNNIKINQAKFEEIGIFEIGSVYFGIKGDIDKDGKGKDFLPYQERHLAVAVSAGGKVDVFSKVKGVIEYLMSSLDLALVYQESESKPGWADGKVCADIAVNGVPIGKIAKLSEISARAAGVKKEVAIAEVSFKKLFDLVKAQSVKKYQKLPKYPSAIRDLAFVVDAKILYNDIKNEIERFNELISEVELFDVYQGEKLGKGKKSLAFHITYQADRTLTAKEVDELQEELVQRLEKNFGAKIRNF